MTTPPPLHPGRDPGDNWAYAADGTRYWGAFGAAGLLAHDAERGVLLQHRAAWSHHGDTWGIPGGALHRGEGPLDGALREAAEEAQVPAGALLPRATHLLDHDVWTYTTLVADVASPFEPVAADAESLALAWVPVDRVADLPLHPGFGASWPLLQEALREHPVVVVDMANVVGSVPDGWWRDRRGAAERLLGRLARLRTAGVASDRLGLGLDAWFPRIIAVVEGQARGAQPRDGVETVAAPGAGDDEIVAQARSLGAAGARVTVVTSDRGLAARLDGAAAVRGAGWLLEMLDEVAPRQ
ncbi:NUDIX domain-containing protein [Demequina mangrovi]|uniref:ADP-ribose pyrophosphatase YjhB, NUDIX family n=1 Tax=Demequina mangrovi TaxID=1043493 RepID=A0A1H6U6S0_9MICO|nr:NUDIX hydrolase [Demequina mangrovi]SEI84020.1 ADP-ribose pyrophosphatase YjhB, NUDIX family [Demequina mangrovi]